MTKGVALGILQDEWENADEGSEGMRPVYAIAIRSVKESIDRDNKRKKRTQ